MSHASAILLHLSSKSHQPEVNKLLSITEGIITELRQKQLDLATSLINKHVSSKQYNVYAAIRNIILNALLTQNDAEITVTEYINNSVLEFTKDEESSILSDIGLDLVPCHPKNLRNIIFGTAFCELTGLRG